MKRSSKNLSSSELSFFCTQIALVLKSGMLISEGIDWMYNDLEEGRIKDAAGKIKEAMSDKAPLHEAMEKSGYFPAYMVNMSQIGSITGRLEDVMVSLSDYYQRDEYIKSKIRNSVFYPAMLFVMMSFVIVFLVVKIFPIFENMVKEMGGEISSEGSALMSFSSGIMAGRYTMFFVVFAFALVLVLLLLWRIPGGKVLFYKFFGIFLPTKKIMKKVTAYRFAYSMSLLLSSGMNIDKSMDILLDIVEDSQLRDKIKQCVEAMKAGDEFIKSLSRLSLFSSIHLQMLNMGQRAGEVDVVMKKLTDIYEYEAEEAINNAVSVVEPVMVGVLSVVIGVILISVMLPLMNIMSSIG